MSAAAWRRGGGPAEAFRRNRQGWKQSIASCVSVGGVQKSESFRTGAAAGRAGRSRCSLLRCTHRPLGRSRGAAATPLWGRHHSPFAGVPAHAVHLPKAPEL